MEFEIDLKTLQKITFRFSDSRFEGVSKTVIVTNQKKFIGDAADALEERKEK